MSGGLLHVSMVSNTGGVDQPSRTVHSPHTMSVIPATAESDRQQNDNLESQVCTQTHFLNVMSESLCYLALPVLKNCSILTGTKFYCPRFLTDSNWCIPIRGEMLELSSNSVTYTISVP